MTTDAKKVKNLGKRLKNVARNFAEEYKICSNASKNLVGPGVTGQNIPPAGLYPGLKRPRLDYIRVYYGLKGYELA